MNELPLTAFDIGVLVILGMSAILSLARGGVRELLSLASWLGALAVALAAFDWLRPIIMDAVKNDLVADIGTGTAVFFVPLIVFKILGRMIANAVSASALGPLDRLLGLVFGVARGALIVAAGYLVADRIVPREEFPEWVQKAALRQPVEQLVAQLERLVPEGLVERSREVVGDAVNRAQELRETQPPATGN